MAQWMNLGQQLKMNAKKYPQTLALCDDRRRLTYPEVNRRVNRLAHRLMQMGLKKGDKLAVLMENSIEINDFVYSIWTYSSSVRNTEWKLIVHNSGIRELFHLPSDPGQHNDIADTRSDMADLLEARIIEWGKKVELIPAGEVLSRIDNETRERLIRTGYW